MSKITMDQYADLWARIHQLDRKYKTKLFRKLAEELTEEPPIPPQASSTAPRIESDGQVAR